MSGTRNSESEFSTHTRKVKVIGEDFGDDVSVISGREHSSISTIILKICLGLIFIGAGTGAIAYSVINSEENQENSDSDKTQYFPINLSQTSQNGNLSMFYNDNDSPKVISYGMSWLQDASNKRIFHRVGLQEDDWQYTYYIFENITFFQTKKRCTRMIQGYNKFIEGLGLNYIRKECDEELKIGGQFEKMVVYEGEPPLDVSINGDHPVLIRGYSSRDRTISYGWELYFDHSNNFTLYRQNYWFPNMKSIEPDWAIFYNIPENCIKS